MAQERHFCPNCGADVLPGNQFCASCGKPVSGAAAAYPSASAEQIAGFIPNAERKQGMFKTETFNIIVSDRRFVFAIMTSQMIRQHVKDDSKKGFFSGVIGALTVGNDYYKKYADMSPEDALKENPGNFAVVFNTIRQVRIVEGHNRTVGHGTPVYDDSYIEIDTTAGKHKFIVKHDAIDNVRNIARKVGFL
jgi:hypothetical protein